MKSNAKSALVFALTASMVLSSAGVSEAKAKKPTLSKTKTTITVGQKQKITVKKVKPKKTTWSLTKKGKKIVSISKKKKTSVYIKGKKVGKATLTAKIKVGKKNYKKTVKITVKKKTAPTVTPQPPVNNATPVPNKPTATPTNKPEDKATPTPTATATATTTATTTVTPTATTTATTTVTPTVTPTATPTATTTATTTVTPTQAPTPTPELITPALNNAWKVKLSDDSEYAKGCVENVQYNADGTATYVAQPRYAGGGVAWYVDANKEPVKVSDLKSLTIKVRSSEASSPVCLNLYTDDSKDWWQAQAIGPANRYSSTSATAGGLTTLTYDLATIANQDASIYAVCLKYNTYGKEETSPSTTMTIESMEFELKKEADALVYENLDPNADYVATVNGKDRNICGEDIAAELDRTVDVDDFYTKWTTKTNKVEKNLCGSVVEIVTKDATNPSVKEVTVKDTDSRLDGTYKVTVNPKAADGTYTINVEKTTGTKVDLVVTPGTGKVTVAGTYNGKDYVTEIALNSENKIADVTVKRDGSTLVKLTKNADATYTVVVDKAEAEKRGFELAKSVSVVE